ncbi:NAD-dependent epimerase/dehydratase family protein [bacterium]|nr:NAD-dependent epimerase/dehydratase family protein [bacterium]NDD85166.1 NAD-dependent epimerase/dehydratase family protein [bacterium]NDG30200.1 NAD-dependent epimerase/dehydratase family protein [bacterium]
MTSDTEGKIVLVTGGEGFIGYNLVRHLVSLADVSQVIVVDNYITSKPKNRLPKTVVIDMDICEMSFVDHMYTHYKSIDEIYHLASLASPAAYKNYVLETLDVGYMGTKNVLELCVHYKCRLLYTSTSEVYGDALEHPQKESYYGNVNPYGERSNYDESKRIGETLIYNYRKLYDVDARIARVFNTYGPHMSLYDGRIVTEIIKAILNKSALVIYGDGSQTRSMCYVEDTVDMLVDLMKSDYSLPINVGNDQEITINELVDIVMDTYSCHFNTRVKLDIRFTELERDDPKQRRPCLQLNKLVLGSREFTNLRKGILETILYFKNSIN